MRKPKIAIMILLAFSIAVICFLLIFFVDPAYTEDISIIIPARNMEEPVYQEDYFYSDACFTPVQDTIRIYAGQDLGDSMVVLMPISVREENAYEPTYITPGLGVELEAEKGGIFRIGVAEQNSSNEDMTITLTIENIKLIEE